MWKLRLIPIIFMIGLIFVPFVNAEEELIVEFDTNLEPDSWDSMNFQEKARRECRIELTANQSVYALVVEPMALELFDGVFNGQTSVSQFEYVTDSRVSTKEGVEDASKQFSLPNIKNEDDLHYENYYFIIVGYGEYPVDWCEGGDDTAHVNVKIYKVNGETGCCIAAALIFVPMGILGVVVLLNVKKNTQR
jgi:hypothetical protein